MTLAKNNFAKTIKNLFRGNTCFLTTRFFEIPVFVVSVSDLFLDSDWTADHATDSLLNIYYFVKIAKVIRSPSNHRHIVKYNGLHCNEPPKWHLYLFTEWGLRGVYSSLSLSLLSAWIDWQIYLDLHWILDVMKVRNVVVGKGWIIGIWMVILSECLPSPHSDGNYTADDLGLKSWLYIERLSIYDQAQWQWYRIL